MHDVSAVFHSLDDPTRRSLLDALRRHDGQTLTELVEHGELSRFGVMKHLGVLEEAGLVTTLRVGRFKHHYLNPAPLLEAVDRWIEPLVHQPATRAILAMKKNLEGNTMPKPEERAPDFVLETYIRTSPERLWEALIDGQLTRQYYMAGAQFRGDVRVGGEYAYRTDKGDEITGVFLDVQPHRRLEMTFQPHWRDIGASRNRYEIDPFGEVVRLRILHFDFPEPMPEVRAGWARIAAGVKTLLETGRPLELPEPEED
ncbi:ArsR/SmtB family transcription factor [Microbacterium sp.]|uniref:ArsR/SmtB family transcription factor n=1 Tax=Microbacterium sp. TaxID=51671 RepID=UPI003A847C8C